DPWRLRPERQDPAISPRRIGRWADRRVARQGRPFAGRPDHDAGGGDAARPRGPRTDHHPGAGRM
ncbi:MAG: hypothetical protein AVDCRST_MAG70-775, partial [uncultured Thermomicrobiales bacterium]